MPPKSKVTKEMIIEAALEIIREHGYEALNARTIAKRLGCSTQPVLYNFKTVDDIREAAYQKADAFHTDFIMPKETDDNPMLALGLNYVRFGHVEKNLFRFLFQTNNFSGMNVETLINSPYLSGVLEVMSKGLKCDVEEARKLFLTFFCAAHGLASLLANNSMEYDEEHCAGVLKSVFYGVVAAKKH